MSSYLAIATPRLTVPDATALLAAVRAAVDPAVGVGGTWPTYTLKKPTAWTPADIAAAQTAIDTAPAVTPQRTAQTEIDGWPIAVKALALALVDQLNVIRAALPVPLPPVTPAQAIAAIRTKAGTLS